MARLPSGRWLIQQIGESVVLFNAETEEEVVRFDPGLDNEVAQAQKTIFGYHRMSDEDKAFAHFWCGYFYAHASLTWREAETVNIIKGAHNAPSA
jgi:hypothetical protein